MIQRDLLLSLLININTYKYGKQPKLQERNPLETVRPLHENLQL